MKELIITSRTRKKKLIKEIREKDPFSNIKFLTLEEFLKEFPYQYNEKALEYIMKKYNIILDIAKIYLKNITLYDINDENFKETSFLTDLKKDLLNKNLLQENILFKNYLKTTSITFIDIPKEKYLLNLLECFNLTWKESIPKNYIPTIYHLDTIEEEIAFVGEQIIKLIHENVPIENIFITNIESDYEIPISRIFKALNIPLTLKQTTTLSETTIGSIFLKNLENGIDESIEKITLLIKTEEDKTIVEQIIKICNKYIDLENKKDFIVYDLTHTTKEKKENEKSIHEIDLDDIEYNSNHYLFILSFNNEIPHIYKDEEFLKDEIKEYLNLDTSKEKNKLEKEKWLTKIKTIPNCIITYKKKTLKQACFPSPLIEELQVTPKEGHLTYTSSNTYNKYVLAESLDKYIKYGDTSSTLTTLKSNYEIPYLTYKNTFTGIPKEKLFKKLNYTLSLSYTKLDTYRKCPFAFYLTYILKIVPYKESLKIWIGNIFHKILKEMFNPEFDFENLYQKEIKNYPLTKKDEFFLNILKDELFFVITNLKEKNKFTDLQEVMPEKEITIDIPNEMKTTFTGITDLIKYEKEKNIFSIIDYKTGTPILDESLMPLGFSMQLPTYLYLITKSNLFERKSIGGFYLQPVLLGKLNKIPKENYIVTKEKALKMIGFSNQNQEILKYVDNSYLDSSIIKGLKTKQNGEFYNYAKVLEDSDFQNLENLAEEKMKDDVKNITNANFQITSKIVDNKNFISCAYCPLKDICYHESKDNIYLNSDKTFLKKEENHGLDE